MVILHPNLTIGHYLSPVWSCNTSIPSILSISGILKYCGTPGLLSSSSDISFTSRSLSFGAKLTCSFLFVLGTFTFFFDFSFKRLNAERIVKRET